MGKSLLPYCFHYAYHDYAFVSFLNQYDLSYIVFTYCLTYLYQSFLHLFLYIINI